MSTLDNLRIEAKRWLKALRADDAHARARLSRAFPDGSGTPSLRTLQHAIAREHGHEDRAALKAEHTSRSASPNHIDRVNRFLEYACPHARVMGRGARRSAQSDAMRILMRHPEIARDSIYTAVVCGDLAEVDHIVSARPEAASDTGGPRRWPPLLYLCTARLPLTTARGDAVAIARALLDRGANPNSYYVIQGIEDYHYTALTCLLGRGEEQAPSHPDAEALVRLLLERGAEPYDPQLMYNVFADNTSRPDLGDDMMWLLELIYTQSVRRGRQADWTDPDWSMLDMGVDRLAAGYLLKAATDGNHLKLANWLLTHGASPTASHSRHSDTSERSLYEGAIKQGFAEMAELLLRFGATPGVVVLDDRETFDAACLRLDREAAHTILERHPEYLHDQEPMMMAARRDRSDVATFLIDLGILPDVGGDGDARALHVAAGRGSRRVAQVLVERGAEVDFRETRYDATPLGWAVHFDRPQTIEYLSGISRDIFNLSVAGNVGRLRQVLGADPQLAKEIHWGMTPLFFLPEDERQAIEVVELFLACGSDPMIKNRAGLTAGDEARKAGYEDVASILRDNSA